MNVIGNAKRNIAVGMINRIVVLVLPFIERMAIQTLLGSQYLGLGSLYASIISVLSLSELGFSTAIVYSMYKPAAEGNIEKMNSLLNFYRKCYRIIGCVIIILGLFLIPALSHLIKGTYPSGISLTLLYLVYLGNASLSYFLFAYLSPIIVVHQRDDISSSINTFVRIGLTVSQIAILLITENYYLFSLLMPVFTIVGNLLTGWRVHTLFPQYKPEGTLMNSDKVEIRKLVSGTFIQQACAVTRNALDSICISAFLGLTLTAIYNNYYALISGVTAFTGLVCASFVGGIGNHVTTRTVEENFQEMKELDFLYLWVGGWCTICLLCLYQPFMTLWMGDKMLLPMSTVTLLCLYFYLLRLGDVRSMYSSANGLWWESRYRSLSETVLNIILNIVLGRLLGIYGIILATIISLFLCNYIWAVEIVFRLYFSMKRRKDYYKYQGKQSMVVFISAAITYGICGILPFERVLFQFVLRGIICLIVPNVFIYFIYRKTDTFIYATKKLLKR